VVSRLAGRIAILEVLGITGVRAFRSRAQPKIPVDVAGRGSWLGALTLRPDRSVRPDVYFFDRADDASTDLGSRLA
jgi:hypothetical protein